VKPGSDLTVILNSDIQEVKDLTINDMVFVWGGTKDVSRNESTKGLIEIRNFVKKKLEHKYYGDKSTHKTGS
jgi:hypothetical protein